MRGFAIGVLAAGVAFMAGRGRSERRGPGHQGPDAPPSEDAKQHTAADDTHAGAPQKQTVVPAGLPAPHHDATNDDEHKRTERRYWKKNYVAAAIQAAATAGAFVFAGFAFVASWRAMEATQEQARVAQDTLVASNRPWLMLADVKPASLTSDDGAGVTLWVNIVAKNVGHSPAQNVSVGARLLIVENAEPRLDAAMHAICQQARETPVVFPGQVVFPDQTEDIHKGTPLAFSIPAGVVWAVREARIKSARDQEMARNRPERAEAWAAALSKFPFYAPLYLTGCVNYWSSDNKLFFQTSFMFGVRAKEAPGATFPLLSGVPPDDRRPEPSPNDPEALMVFPRRMQRTVDGEQIELGRPLYPTFAR